MSNTVINPDLRVAEVLATLAAHYGKSYCYPSQQKIRALLLRFTGRAMSLRTLNRHLNALVRDLLLRRTRRHQRGADGRLILRSTLYNIGLRWAQRAGRLARQATLWAKKLMPSMTCSAVPLMAVNKRQNL